LTGTSIFGIIFIVPEQAVAFRTALAILSREDETIRGPSRLTTAIQDGIPQSRAQVR
jgi:hypothetical protein